MQLKLSQLRSVLALWCSGYHYCTTSFNKAGTQVLRRLKSCLRRAGDSQWWGSLTMVPTGNRAKRLSSVNHTTKTIHHHHCQFFIPLENIRKPQIFDVFRGHKREYWPEWVKQLQYRRERHNLMLFAWNASGSIVKQNDCKNKTTWLTETALSKSFSLIHATHIEDIKEILRGLFFRLKLLLC